MAALSGPILLAEPIRRGEAEPIAEVRLRRPTAGGLRGLHLTELLRIDVVEMTALLARITDPVLTESEIASLDARSFTTLSGAALLFLVTREDLVEQGL